MKPKKLILVGAFAATIALGTAVSANAATCNVPSGSYPTIQSAAADPSCDTINVAPGVYNENVNVTHSATINGAQAGSHDFATRSANSAAESVVKGAGPTVSTPIFTINASDVTIDGFTIKNAVNLFSSSGVEVKGPGNDAAILNNIFDGISTGDTSGNGSAQAVYLSSGGADNVNIQDNEMKNIHANRSTKGVLIGDNSQPGVSTNVQVKGNSIHDIISDTRGAYAVSVGKASSQSISALAVVENTISNLTGGGWVHAIGLEGDTPGVQVMSNTISSLNNATGDNIAVWFESNPSFSSAQVQMNNFNLTVASFGIAVQPTLTGTPLNGTCNWWNSPSGPTTATNPAGTGTKVSDKVTYNPWLIAPASGGSCFGGNVPTAANQCKSGGWMTQTRADGSTFKNQGDCIQYTNTGK